MPTPTAPLSRAVDAPTPIRRELPLDRIVQVPAGEAALLVREGRPDRVLPSGRQRIRRLWQPRPELYFYGVGSHFFPLWITELSSADGVAVNLGWRLQVKVTDPARLWATWLRYQENDAIELPASQISARLADPVHELVRRYSLADLRTDDHVRRQVAGQLSLLLKQQLDSFGLAIGEQFDPQQLRFQTDADLAAAAKERAALARMLADEQVETLLKTVDNAEMLEYRLREWRDAHQAPVGDDVLGAIAESAVSPGADVMERVAPSSLQPPGVLTPEPVQVAAVQHGARWHLLRNLSQFVGVAVVVAALVLAGIAYFEPRFFATPEARNQTIAIVGGLTLLGLFVAWVLDQLMRWEAQRAARRLLREASLNHGDVATDGVELRHMLMLLAALLGISAAVVAFWLPEYYRWLRLGGAVVGLLAAGYAIRLDWLHNVEKSHAVLAHAQRRIASSRLSDAERVRRHTRFQADLTAESDVTAKRLEHAASLAYRNLRDRTLVSRIQCLQKQVENQRPRIEALEHADGQRSEEEWDQVDGHMVTLQSEVRQCSSLAEKAYNLAQQPQAQGLTACVTELEQAVKKVDDQLTRWPAVAA